MGSILDYLKSSTVHGTGVYNVIIAGGEVGGCTVDCAHGMFTTHDEKYSKKEAATLKKSRDFDTKSLAYILKKSQFQDAGAFIANTIGGGMHNDELEDYDFVSYRNSPPKYNNVSPVMAPDSVLAIKELFDERIQAYSHSSFSDMKYIAVQIRKSTFRDQKIYGIIARELDKLSNNQSLPIIFFRAGAATHHDSLSTYRDLGKRMSSEYYIMEDLDIWKICALISRAQLQVSTRMHIKSRELRLTPKVSTTHSLAVWTKTLKVSAWQAHVTSLIRPSVQWSIVMNSINQSELRLLQNSI